MQFKRRAFIGPMHRDRPDSDQLEVQTEECPQDHIYTPSLSTRAYDRPHNHQGARALKSEWWEMKAGNYRELRT